MFVFVAVTVLVTVSVHHICFIAERVYNVPCVAQAHERHHTNWVGGVELKWPFYLAASEAAAHGGVQRMVKRRHLGNPLLAPPSVRADLLNRLVPGFTRHPAARAAPHGDRVHTHHEAVRFRRELE